MNTYRTTLISTAASDAQLPAAFAAEMIAQAPWLDGTQELNEQLAAELLAAEVKRFDLSSMQLTDFIQRYNTLVQATENPLAALQSEAFIAFGQALAPYGRADAFGEGDYWLVSDSFSTRAPVIQVFEDFRFPAAALCQLQEVLNRYTSVFSELRVNTEYGAEVTPLTPQ